MPQWAVIGWPGQTGQTSFAALSQTVKTKSSLGESGFANSSQGLLRAPQAGIRAASSCRRASGLTVPLGWLPALKALKFGLPLMFRRASAMIERAELPVQRKSTLYCFGVAALLGRQFQTRVVWREDNRVALGQFKAEYGFHSLRVQEPAATANLRRSVYLWSCCWSAKAWRRYSNSSRFIGSLESVRR